MLQYLMCKNDQNEFPQFGISSTTENVDVKCGELSSLFLRLSKGIEMWFSRLECWWIALSHRLPSHPQTTRTYHSVSALWGCCACRTVETLLEIMEDTSRDARPWSLDKMRCLTCNSVVNDYVSTHIHTHKHTHTQNCLRLIDLWVVGWVGWWEQRWLTYCTL